MDYSKMKIAYVIKERGDQKYWNRVGVAFVNGDGSINVRLEAVPVNGELHIRDYVPRADGAGRGKSQGSSTTTACSTCRRDETLAGATMATEGGNIRREFSRRSSSQSAQPVRAGVWGSRRGPRPGAQSGSAAWSDIERASGRPSSPRRSGILAAAWWPSLASARRPSRAAPGNRCRTRSRAERRANAEWRMCKPPRWSARTPSPPEAERRWTRARSSGCGTSGRWRSRAQTEASASPGLTADGKVILNLATITDLRKLPGIGQKRAQAILDLRQKLGGRFRKVTDLLRVKGIGGKRLAQARATRWCSTLLRQAESARLAPRRISGVALRRLGPPPSCRARRAPPFHF